LVNLGTWMVLVNLFNNLFSLPGFLVEIGNPNAEIHAAHVTGRSEAGETNLREQLPSPARIPVDPIRRVAANNAARIAFDFLILHELGHVRNGHLPLLNTSRQIVELEAPPAEQDIALTYQTLEMDADSHAVVHGINEIMRLAGAKFQGPHGNELAAIFASQQTSLSLYLAAVYGLFRLFDRGLWQADRLWSSTHPPAAMRQHMIHSTVYAVVERAQDHALLAQLPDLTAKVVGDVERGIANVTGIKRRPEGLLLAIERFPAYWPLLSDRWSSLHPKLDMLKLGGNLAPPHNGRQ
jgi:hypothetical protein